MLNLLDDSLAAFLRAEVPDLRDVDVSFDPPDKDWAASLGKPTVNLFLYDVRRNLDERHAGWEHVHTDDGRQRREPLPRVDCHYLATAWTSAVDDEHKLLGDVLACLMAFRQLPGDYLQGALAEIRPAPSLSVNRPNGRDIADFWSALGGRLKPGLDLVATLTFDRTATIDAGKPVDRINTLTRDRHDRNDRRTETLRVGGHTRPPAPGAVVHSPRGVARVDKHGHFLIPAQPGDKVAIADETGEADVGEMGRIDLPRDSETQ